MFDVDALQIPAVACTPRLIGVIDDFILIRVPYAGIAALTELSRRFHE